MVRVTLRGANATLVLLLLIAAGAAAATIEARTFIFEGQAPHQGATSSYQRSIGSAYISPMRIRFTRPEPSISNTTSSPGIP